MLTIEVWNYECFVIDYECKKSKLESQIKWRTDDAIQLIDTLDSLSWSYMNTYHAKQKIRRLKSEIDRFRVELDSLTQVYSEVFEKISQEFVKKYVNEYTPKKIVVIAKSRTVRKVIAKSRKKSVVKNQTKLVKKYVDMDVLFMDILTRKVRLV